MYCKFCGNEIEDGVKYCPRCGGIATETETAAEEVYEAELVRDPVTDEECESAAKKSLVFGILSIAFGSVIGFIFALVGRKQAKKSAALNGGSLTAKAKVGNILSTVGIPYGILTLISQIMTIVSVITAFLESGLV